MAEEEQRYEVAERFYDDAASLVEEVGDRMGLSRCYHHKGRLKERMGDYAQAFDLHKQSLELKEALGDTAGMATSFHHLGNTYFFTKDMNRARECYEKALEIETMVNDHPGRAGTLQQLGAIEAALFQWSKAYAYYAAAERVWRKISAHHQIKRLTPLMATVKGNLDPAELKEADRQGRKIADI